MFRAVNVIATALQLEFPTVAVDTLAYKWSRPAPKLKPRGNVIIRLCPIECNFAVPMTDPSNAEFQADMNAWSAVSSRTFIWNYQTNFGMPFQILRMLFVPRILLPPTKSDCTDSLPTIARQRISWRHFQTGIRLVQMFVTFSSMG